MIAGCNWELFSFRLYYCFFFQWRMTTPTFFLMQVQKPIMEWSHHFTTNVWWSAAKYGGAPNLLLEMITSMKYHIEKVHNQDVYGHELFCQCSHEQILPLLTMFSWIVLNFLSV